MSAILTISEFDDIKIDARSYRAIDDFNVLWANDSLFSILLGFNE